MDATALQATLEAHNNSVERCVDYLLSSTSPHDQATTFQLQQDEEIARRLQAEQDAEDNAAMQPPGNATQMPAIPSMADVQNAVKPIIDGVQYAGRAAAQGVQNLYRDYVAPPERAGSAYRREEPEQDETVILRGEGGGGRAGGARQRRPLSGGYGGGSSDKKDA